MTIRLQVNKSVKSNFKKKSVQYFWLVLDSLFAYDGEKWKNLRSKLSPIFTSGKLKSMFPLIVICSDHFREVLEEPAKINGIVDVKELAQRYTIESILFVVFGIECDFLKDPNSTVGKMAVDFLQPNYVTAAKLFCAIFIPEVAEILKVCIC